MHQSVPGEITDPTDGPEKYPLVSTQSCKNFSEILMNHPARAPLSLKGAPPETLGGGG